MTILSTLRKAFSGPKSPREARVLANAKRAAARKAHIAKHGQFPLKPFHQRPWRGLGVPVARPEKGVVGYTVSKAVS